MRCPRCGYVDPSHGATKCPQCDGEYPRRNTISRPACEGPGCAAEATENRFGLHLCAPCARKLDEAYAILTCAHDTRRHRRV